MDPKQWRTRHTSIQDMPGPLDLRYLYNHLKNCHHMLCRRNQEGDVGRRGLNIQEGIAPLGMRRTAMEEIAPSKSGPGVVTLSGRNRQKGSE